MLQRGRLRQGACRILWFLFNGRLNDSFGLLNWNPDQSWFFNRPAGRHSFVGDWQFFASCIRGSNLGVTLIACPANIVHDFVVVNDCQLAKGISVFQGVENRGNILILGESALNRDSTLQDNVHKVWFVSLFKDLILRWKFHKLGKPVDLQSHICVVPLDVAKMAHHDIKHFVAAIFFWYWVLISNLLNISLCVAQSLIDLLTIFSFWRDHLAFNKDFIIVLCLWIRLTIQLLKLELQFFLFKFVSRKSVDHLVWCLILACKGISQPCDNLIFVALIIILNVDVAITSQNLHLVEFGTICV